MNLEVLVSSTLSSSQHLHTEILEQPDLNKVQPDLKIAQRTQVFKGTDLDRVKEPKAETS